MSVLADLVVRVFLASRSPAETENQQGDKVLPTPDAKRVSMFKSTDTSPRPPWLYPLDPILKQSPRRDLLAQGNGKHLAHAVRLALDRLTAARIAVGVLDKPVDIACFDGLLYPIAVGQPLVSYFHRPKASS